MKALAIALAMVLALPAYAGQDPKVHAQETLVALSINGKPVSETQSVWQAADGDIYLPVEQWASYKQLVLDLKGKRGLVSARSLGLDPQFHADTQSIDLIATGKLLPKQRLRQTQAMVNHVDTWPRGAFTNYDLSIRMDEKRQLHASLGHEVRAGVFKGTVTMTGQLNHDPEGSRYVRGLSTWNLDLLSKGTTLQAGDVFTARTTLSSPVNVGGVRIASDRQLRSDESYLPVPMLGGIAQTATTAELFVNGSKQAQYSIEPGPWQMDQYSVKPGTNQIRTVLRDDYGREEIFTDTFYYSPYSLPKGMTEWDVALGKVRLDSDRYDTLALSANATHGFGRYWTTGASLQATSEARNLTITNRLTLGTKGALGVDVSASTSPQGNGRALQVAYDYRNDDWSVHASHARYSDDHWTLAKVRDQGIGLDLNLASTTSLGLAWAPRGRDWAASIAAMDLAYQDGRKQTRIDGALRLHRGNNDFGAGVGYDPVRRQPQAFLTWRHRFNDGSLSSTVRAAPEIEARTLYNGQVLAGNLPIRYTAGLAHDERGTQAMLQADTRLPAADISMQVEHRATGNRARGTIRGSLWVGEGGVMAQRTSYNGFVLAQVPKQAGVPVSVQGTEQRTNRFGYALVPNVAPLRTVRVSMDPTALPLNAQVQRTSLSTATGRKAGAKVRFEIASEQVVELRIQRDGKPLAGPGQIKTEMETVPMGQGGIAYLMQGKPGQRIEVIEQGQSCKAQLPAVLKDMLEIDCR